MAVTGANGFIGRHLVEYLRDDHEVRCVIRSEDQVIPEWRNHFDVVTVGAIGGRTDWTQALDGVDVVVHLAAIAHRAKPDVHELAEVNIEGLRCLTKQAIRQQVRRIVFLSTIGVHGSITTGEPFDEKSSLRPHDAYSWSKVKAEEVLKTVTRDQKLEYVIVRPPLVYGPSAPGNFRRLVSWLRRGVPLPFGSLENVRSLVSVVNLSDFVSRAAVDARAANQAFVVSDGEDVSIPDLIRYMAAAMQVDARLINVPVWMLRVGLGVVGRSRDFWRLCGSLQVDSGHARALLGWQPPLDFPEALRASVADPPNA